MLTLIPETYFPFNLQLHMMLVLLFLTFDDSSPLLLSLPLDILCI
jgi:hypothetical protein